MAVCYRRPSDETGGSRSNSGKPICPDGMAAPPGGMGCPDWGKPICPDCMPATRVGMRCPDCSRQRTPVKTLRNIYAEPTVTYVLIGACVLLYLGMWSSGGVTSSVYFDLATIGNATLNGDPIGVANGEVYRLITGAFLHDPRNPLHILFNMYVLYWLGTMLEPVLGHWRFAALYFASLLAGSFGVMLASPNSVTGGASGAGFGLMAAAFVFQRARGGDPWRARLGPGL